MNLPMRQHKKRNQALDAFASVAKTWSEWRLGERASQTVAKGTKKASKSAAKARKNAAKAAKNTDASSVKRAMKGTPLKVAGAVALVGGVGAAVAKKLKGGGGAEPLYTPPAPPAPMPAADMTNVPAAPDMTNVPAPPDMTNVPPAPPTPVVVGDLGSSDEPGAPEPEAAADETSAPENKPAGESAVAASEAAIAAASEPAEDDVTEPTVPDTDPGGDDDADAAADPDTVADDDPETPAGKD